MPIPSSSFVNVICFIDSVMIHPGAGEKHRKPLCGGRGALNYGCVREVSHRDATVGVK